eukprot:1161456-Pelagomonas_calceolata.AAC.2
MVRRKAVAGWKAKVLTCHRAVPGQGAEVLRFMVPSSTVQAVLLVRDKEWKLGVERGHAALIRQLCLNLDLMRSSPTEI